MAATLLLSHSGLTAPAEAMALAALTPLSGKSATTATSSSSQLSPSLEQCPWLPPTLSSDGGIDLG